MFFEGKVIRQGKWWVSEVSVLDLMTQGKTRKQALEMISDALLLLVDQTGFKITLKEIDKTTFVVSSNQVEYLVALLLKRQRVKNQLSIQDLQERLKVRSKNTYAQYEQARSLPSLLQLDSFLKAMGLSGGLSLNLVQL